MERSAPLTEKFNVFTGPLEMRGTADHTGAQERQQVLVRKQKTGEGGTLRSLPLLGSSQERPGKSG